MRHNNKIHFQLNGIVYGLVEPVGVEDFIYCLGNLTVDKEILDSRIITSGAVIIKRGYDPARI